MTRQLKDHLVQEIVDCCAVIAGTTPQVRERDGECNSSTLIMGFGGPGKNNAVKLTSGETRKCFMQRWVPVKEDQPVAGWTIVKKVDITNGISDSDMAEIIDFLSEDFDGSSERYPAEMDASDPTDPTCAKAVVIQSVEPIGKEKVLVNTRGDEPIILKGFAARRILHEVKPSGKIVVRHLSGIFRVLKESKFRSLYNVRPKH